MFFNGKGEKCFNRNNFQKGGYCWQFKGKKTFQTTFDAAALEFSRKTVIMPLSYGGSPRMVIRNNGSGAEASSPLRCVSAGGLARHPIKKHRRLIGLRCFCFCRIWDGEKVVWKSIECTYSNNGKALHPFVTVRQHQAAFSLARPK